MSDPHLSKIMEPEVLILLKDWSKTILNLPLNTLRGMIFKIRKLAYKKDLSKPFFLSINWNPPLCWFNLENQICEPEMTPMKPKKIVTLCQWVHWSTRFLDWHRWFVHGGDHVEEFQSSRDAVVGVNRWFAWLHLHIESVYKVLLACSK